MNESELKVKIISEIDTSDLQSALEIMSSSIGEATVKLTNKFAPITAAVMAVGFGLEDTSAIAGTTLTDMATKSKELAAVFSGMEVALMLFNKQEEISNALSIISTGWLTAKTVGTLALGTAHQVLAGDMTLATGATEALALAQMALPSGWVMAAIAGIGVAIAGLILMQDDEITASEKLGENWEKASEAGKEFQDGIASAQGVLSGFNEEIIISSEDHTKLTEAFSKVQSDISAISRLAVDERRTLTQDEMGRMDDLFNQMHELASQELDIQNEYQDAVLTRVQTSAQMGKISEEESQNILKSAEETKNKVIEKAQEQYNSEIIMIKKKHEAAGTLNSEAYQNEINQAYTNLEDAKLVAEQKNADIYEIVQQGYLDSNEQASEGLEAIKEHNRLKQEENDSFNALATENYAKGAQELGAHNKRLKEIDDDLLANMDENATQQLAVWGTMLGDTIEKGGQITEEDKKNAQAIIDSWDSLPEETKDTMEKTLKPMLEQAANYNGDFKYAGTKEGESFEDGISSKKKDVKDATDGLVDNAVPNNETVKSKFSNTGISIVGGMLGGIGSMMSTITTTAGSVVGAILYAMNKAAKINSPSRLFRDKIGKSITLGVAVGMESQEGLLSNIGKGQVELLSRNMQMAVNCEKLKFDSAIASTQMNTIFMTPTHQTQEPLMGNLNGVIENHISIDGRETAIQLTPFISEEIAFKGGL